MDKFENKSDEELQADYDALRKELFDQKWSTDPQLPKDEADSYLKKVLLLCDMNDELRRRDATKS